MGCPAHRRHRSAGPPTDAEYHEQHERREAEREVECFCSGRAYSYQPFNRKEWPPYPYRSGLPLKVKR
jgi:hypothetical protein